MSSITFKSRIKRNAIAIPVRLRKKISEKKRYRVVILEESESYDDDMERVVAREMLQQYAPEDSVYDKYAQR